MLNVRYIVMHSMLCGYHPVPIVTKRFALILVPFMPMLTHIHTPLPPHRLIISDLDTAFRQLDNCCDQPLSRLDGESAYNPLDVQAAAIFDLTVLSQLSNTCKAVIGVWVHA